MTQSHPLLSAEPRFAEALALAGPLPPLKRRAPGFGTLLKIILEQQVSVHAAEAMWRKLEAACAPLDPATFAALPDEVLRSCGFSRQKASYGRALAADIAEGRFDLETVHAMDDADAIAALTRLKGIGRWSAEIYLLFALERTDIWPADDLALQMGAQSLFGLAERPKRGALDTMAEAWRPWRTQAARLIWHHYLAVRRRPYP